MAFEGINTAGLRSALNNCKNQLNYNYSNQLIGTLSGNDWISDSKNNLKGAVERLINDISEFCKEELDDLYREDEKEEAVKRTIKNTVRNRGCYDPEDIKKYVKIELEYDRDLCLRQGFDPRRG